MTATDPRAFFGDKAQAYRSSRTHANPVELARMVTLLEAHGPLKGARAVDVATGGGPTAVALARAGARVIPTDVTPSMLDAVQASAADAGVPLAARVLADAQRLPLRDASVDVVTSRIAPHHFPDVAAFVRESARVLRRGGRFYVFDLTTPEGRPAARRVINGIERLRDPSHGDSYPPDVWRAALADAGFPEADVTTAASTFPLEPWIRRAAMPPERERALRALLAEPPVDLGGYGLTAEGEMRVLRVEVVGLKAA